MKHLFKFLCLLMMTTHASQAMETPENSITFFIEMLPREIQNLIAQYLKFYDRETDAEFIERTKQLVPNPHISSRHHVIGGPSDTPEEKKLYSYSPNKAYSITACDGSEKFSYAESGEWSSNN